MSPIERSTPDLRGLIRYYVCSGLVSGWICLNGFLALWICPLRWLGLDVNFLFSRLICPLGQLFSGIRVDVEGIENLRSHESRVYVANHQSGFDIISFAKAYPRQTVMVAKKELLWIPFFGQAFPIAGNLLIDRKNASGAVAELARLAKKLKQTRRSVLMFPEGTRNRSGKPLLPFKNGAFHMAILEQMPVVPIICGRLQELYCSPKRISRSGRLKVRILEPISTQGLKISDAGELSKEVRERMLRAYRDISG